MRETVDKYGRIDVLLKQRGDYVTQKLWKGPVEELALENGTEYWNYLQRRLPLQQSGDPHHEKNKEAARSSTSLRALSLGAPKHAPLYDRQRRRLR